MAQFFLRDGCSYAVHWVFSWQTYTVAMQIIVHTFLLTTQSNTTISFEFISNFKRVYEVLILQNAESKYVRTNSDLTMYAK